MAEFFLLPRGISYLLTLIFALCALSQTLLMVLSSYRYPHNRIRVFETLLELVILGNIIVCSILHGQTMQSYEMGLLAPMGHTSLRILFFVLIVASSILATLPANHALRPQVQNYLSGISALRYA